MQKITSVKMTLTIEVYIFLDSFICSKNFKRFVKKNLVKIAFSLSCRFPFLIILRLISATTKRIIQDLIIKTRNSCFDKGLKACLISALLLKKFSVSVFPHFWGEVDPYSFLILIHISHEKPASSQKSL